jgi:hypothetical protein
MAARLCDEEEALEDGGWSIKTIGRLGFWCFVLAGIFMSTALLFASTTTLAPLLLVIFISNFWCTTPLEAAHDHLRSGLRTC